MRFYKNIVIIILSFLFVKPAFSSGSESELLFEKRFDGVQRVEFNPHDRGHYRITNIFLQNISEANRKLRVFTTYNINYTIEVHLDKIGEGIGELNIYLSDLSLDGDIYYRDFVIEDVLVPSGLKLCLGISVNGRQSFFKFNPPVPGFIEKNRLIHSQTVELSFNDNTLTDMHLADVLFYYDEPALQRFKTLVNALFSYYESVEKLDMVVQQLKILNLDRPGRVIIDEFRFYEAERMFWNVYHSPFRKELDLDEMDPAGFKDLFLPLKDSVLFYRERFNYNFSRLDELYYSEGLQKMAEGKRRAALESFQQAIVYNPSHIPSHLSVADIYLLTGKISPASEVVHKVLKELYPREAHLDSTMYYIEKIFDNYFILTDSLNEKGKHTEALKIIKKADQFDNDIPVLDYHVELDERFTDAHTGIYESFLEVIGRAVTVNGHSFALTYIDHAIDYKDRHGIYVEGSDRVYGFLQQLTDRLIMSGRERYVHKDFRAAESIFSDLVEVCEKYSFMDCADDATNYLALAQDARREAELITVEVTIEDPLPELTADDVTERLKEEMLKELSHGHLKAWAGETSEARRILEEMVEKSALYGLRRDSLINARMVTLSKRIREKECELAGRDFDKYFKQYFELIDDKDFTKANEMLVKVENLHNENPDCEFGIEKIEEEKGRISPAVKYEDMMENVRNLYFNQARNDHELFLKSYESVDNYYREKNVETFGLEHKFLFEFIKSSSDQGLIISGVSFYAGRNQPGNALGLLFRLKELGVKRNSVANIQEYAGKMAAKHYAAKSPDTPPREVIRNLTDNDRWMRYYNRAFIRSW